MKLDCPIAIIGMGGVFPGAADLRTFWSNIAQARDMAREVPPGRGSLSRDERSPTRQLLTKSCRSADVLLRISGSTLPVLKSTDSYSRGSIHSITSSSMPGVMLIDIRGWTESIVIALE